MKREPKNDKKNGDANAPPDRGLQIFVFAALSLIIVSILYRVWTRIIAPISVLLFK